MIDAEDQPLGRLASRSRDRLARQAQADLHPARGHRRLRHRRQRHEGEAHGRKLDAEEVLPPQRRARRLPDRRAYGDLLERKPEVPIEKAVKGMLPKNILGRELLTKLKVYAGPDHPHAAQKPATAISSETRHGRRHHLIHAFTPPASARRPSRASGSSAGLGQDHRSTAPRPTTTSSARRRA